MRHISARPSRRPARILTGLAAALSALSTATPALAQPWPPPPGHGHPPAQTHTIVVGGMPGWQIALIALAAALIAATAAIRWERAQARHRQLPATAQPATAAGHDNSNLPTVTLGPGRW